MSDTTVRRRVDVGRVILVVEGILLVLLGVAGLLGANDLVLGFALNRPHAIALVVTGGLALLVAVRRRLVLVFAVLQFLAYGAAFLYGASTQGRPADDMWRFNQPDSWLHLGVAIVSLVIAYTVAAARGAHRRVKTK
ncbi:DUF4383 domain-containing protein [Kutzneria buriramensis]|uniref:Uncharacterized protein DUF4383 n=1 Tax=Kutzneria buriramensis TaxID=1045776 RepID=A0A3E0H990_9PSEU|nr:DUF4383 domain-containing protein [Kutzneria buriramensis]REH39426.1 uncharacterized protein DUF4383 [Kutzneria buriramensis]